MVRTNDEGMKLLNEISKDTGVEGYHFDSSVIKFAYFNARIHELFIRFASGRGYYYKNVERRVWREFVNAESQGKYFNEYIRGRYEFELDAEAA